MIWGDEAPLKKCGPRQIRALLWSGLFNCLPSSEGKVVGALSDTSDVCQRVVSQQQYAALSWSFSVALTGRWPYEDHLGRRFTEKDGYKYHKRGTLLVPGGFKLALSGISGDLKHFKEEFTTTPNYATSPHICFMCKASVKGDDHFAYDPSLTASWATAPRPAHEHRSQSNLATIPGYSVFMMREDYLHVDLQGVRPFVNGGCFQLALEAGCFGPPVTGGSGLSWQERMLPQLRWASQELRSYCNLHKLSCYIQPFKTCILCLNVLDSTPYLKAKAHAQAIVSLWLEDVMERCCVLDTSQEAKTAHMTIHGMNTSWHICQAVKDRQSIFMTADEMHKLEEARCQSLHGYHALWTQSQELGKHRWGVIPKCHYMDHMYRRAITTSVSMGTWWTFSDEDWIGRGAKLGSMVHAASMNRRPLERWLVGFLCE